MAVLEFVEQVNIEDTGESSKIKVRENGKTFTAKQTIDCSACYLCTVLQLSLHRTSTESVCSDFEDSGAGKGEKKGLTEHCPGLFTH